MQIDFFVGTDEAREAFDSGWRVVGWDRETGTVTLRAPEGE